MLVNKFLIGCDPEFVTIDNRGEIYHVHEIPANGPVGLDHGDRVIELRPEPAKGVYTLVSRIQRLLKDDRLQKMPVAKWRSGAHVLGQSLGGHIHLDKDPGARNPNTGYYDAILPQIKALDHMTHRLEALDILPKTECEQRRKGGMYGRFSDVRLQPGPHMEYRTMASWLFSPKVAFLCLTAAKLATVDPEGCIETLGRFHNFDPFRKFFENFMHKDDNAARAVDKLLSRGIAACQADPDADFKGKWERLGL